MEPALWDAKAEDDAKYDSTSDFKGFESFEAGHFSVAAEKVVGCIVDTSTRN